MNTTRSSLIERVKDPRDASAWREFNRVYFRLLCSYAKTRGLSRDDAEDIAQQCMEAVSRSICRFEYARTSGGFKCWLRRIANNKVTDFHRKRRDVVAESHELRRADSRAISPDQAWDEGWEQEHLRHCLSRLKSLISPKSYQAFKMFTLDQKPAVEVARELGMTPNHVYVNKSRVLEKLKTLVEEVFGESILAD